MLSYMESCKVKDYEGVFPQNSIQYLPAWIRILSNPHIIMVLTVNDILL